MTIHRNPLAAALVSLAFAALPALAQNTTSMPQQEQSSQDSYSQSDSTMPRDEGNRSTTTTTTTTTTKHRYVYYADHNIYFAPETKTYYWQSNGRWTSGTTLPPEDQAYVHGKGFSIELDTDRPYERNDYVIAQYKRHPLDRDHDGDRDRDRE
ncbi:MAG TPA: hypothetical protein VFB32_08960 [Rudaea sp.]|nr:hypothetical protein [Rudaea sp.]